MQEYKMLMPKSSKIKSPKAMPVKKGRGRPKVSEAMLRRIVHVSLQSDIIAFLNNTGFKSKSRFVNLAIRTAMEFKKYRSLPYDTCNDCLCDMTAIINPLDGANTVVDSDNRIIEVYVQCEGCGGRAGHRQYDAEKHGIDI